MPEKSAFRRRVVPSYPYVLEIEDESGKFTMAFKLCYTLSAFCLFEDVTKRNFLREMGEILDVPSVSLLTVLLWAGATNTKDPDYELLDALRENATLSSMPAMKEAIIHALLAQLPAEIRDRLQKILDGEKVPTDPTQPATETVSQ